MSSKENATHENTLNEINKNNQLQQEEYTKIPEDEINKNNQLQQEEYTKIPEDEINKNNQLQQEEYTKIPEDEINKNNQLQQEEYTKIPEDEFHDSDDSISKLKSELITYNSEYIAKLKSELAESKNHICNIQLRAKAEIENIRRRTALDIEKIHKFSLEKFINELLPVIDNLERALEVTNKLEIKSSSTIEGIELTLKSFLNAVHKFGVQVISEINIPFDPEIHQAMSVLESNSFKENYVISIMQHGYKLNGRLLRPAMVIVAKSKNT